MTLHDLQQIKHFIQRVIFKMAAVRHFGFFLTSFAINDYKNLFSDHKIVILEVLQSIIDPKLMIYRI